MPNDRGNYRGKRTPNPRMNGGKPLTPRERFFRLRAAFVSCRKSYLNFLSPY